MTNFDINSYEIYIVAFSGGKDSIACFLHLLDMGIPASKIELWHHLIDGKEETFMDWEVTEDYCRKFAEAFDVKIYFSWKHKGFKGELLREDALTQPMMFETPSGKIEQTGGVAGKKSTRLKFPQITANLTTRWCSGYLKIDVMASAIRNQDRFKGKRTLVLSGERGEESAARAKYEINEPDRSDRRDGKLKRHVDRFRPIRDWEEKQVWEIIERYRVVAHPCYYLGWSRCSCKFCIFGNANQMASAYYISPKQGDDIIQYEKSFGCTIKRNIDMTALIDKGAPYDSINDELAKIATDTVYRGEIFTANWVLPSGAYGESCGPT